MRCGGGRATGEKARRREGGRGRRGQSRARGDALQMVGGAGGSGSSPALNAPRCFGGPWRGLLGLVLVFAPPLPPSPSLRLRRPIEGWASGPARPREQGQGVPKAARGWRGAGGEARASNRSLAPRGLHVDGRRRTGTNDPACRANFCTLLSRMDLRALVSRYAYNCASTGPPSGV